MTKTADKTLDTAAADAAVQEVDDATPDTATITVDGNDYTFARKRMQAIQFRREMQRHNDALAVAFLLGEDQFDQWLDASADEDGVTDIAAYERLMVEVGRVFGMGN